MSQDPHFAPVGFQFAVVSVSVSTSTSAKAAGVGPFRGLFFKVSSSITIIGMNNEPLVLNAVLSNVTLWISGSHISVIATATSVYALV